MKIPILLYFLFLPLSVVDGLEVVEPLPAQDEKDLNY